MKMDTVPKKQAMTMAELLPGLRSLLSKDAMQSMMARTATKKPRQTIANTSEKSVKPLTIAEMRTEIRSLQGSTAKKNVQMTVSVKKKWNSSCKLENKTVSHTANGQMKHNSVRKVLNFQPPKPKAPKSFANSRMTMMTSESSKFPTADTNAKKSLHLQPRNTVRISGICSIPETPVLINKPIKSRMTLANKENIANQSIIHKKLIATPKSTLRKRVMASRIPDTPLSNESWKSNGDASFLQNEQDIEFIENKVNALANEHSLDNIAQVSPPVSTPFADYRNDTNFSNYSSNVMENTNHDDTIMSFNNVSKENSKREESVIVSLCDMLNRATVSNTETPSTELDDLLEVQKRTENNIKMIDIGIKTLNNIKESHLKSLQCVNKLIQEKKSQQTFVSDKENTIIVTKALPKNESSKLDIGEPCSVIKKIQKSPSYKIPKKNLCIRKKVFYKSMPNIGSMTPQKDMGEKALSMYLKMKERHNYLNTPVEKKRPLDVPDTPAITSHNLQKQLDKLYDGN